MNREFKSKLKNFVNFKHNIVKYTNIDTNSKSV